MGRKVHPIGFRLKINQHWEGRWFAKGKNIVENLQQDFAIREMIHREMPKKRGFPGLKSNGSPAR